MNVFCKTRRDRDTLLKFLFSLKYRNGIRKSFSLVEEEVDYDTWPVIVIEKGKKNIDFHSKGAVWENEWPKDASVIIDYITTEDITMEIGDYTATIHPSKSVVEVGCQKIPFSTVEALHKLIQEVKR